MEAHIIQEAGHYLVRLFERDEFGLEEGKGALVASRIQAFPKTDGEHKIDMFQGDRFIGTITVKGTRELENQIQEVQNA